MVLISCDYGPASMPETDPMYLTLLHQCFRRKLRPIIMTLVADGPGLALRGLQRVLEAKDPADGQAVLSGPRGRQSTIATWVTSPAARR